MIVPLAASNRPPVFHAVRSIGGGPSPRWARGCDLLAPPGFAAETTSAAAILASAQMGFGLSTTEVWSGSVIGSGVGPKLSKVRWGTAPQVAYGWLRTLPAAALSGAIATAIALTGPIGVVIVMTALVAGTTTIVAISRRTAVTGHNVTEARDVTVQFSRTPAEPAAASARAASTPAVIVPIIVRQPAMPPPTTETTSTGQQS